MYRIIRGDNLDWFDQTYRRFDTIFADPPDNIGLGYNEYVDKVVATTYTTSLSMWLHAFIPRAETTWLSFNSRWLLPMAAIAQQVVDKFGVEFKPCVQTFSFYQNNKFDLGNAHRPLWRFCHPGVKLYPEAVKVPSWRQLNGDKRATAGGKVPGDAFDFTKLPEKQRRDWHTRAVQSGEWVVDALIPDDHFDFTRVTGNSKQRRNWHPTQLGEGLVERCVRLTTPNGGTVMDPFAGTGTTLRVCKSIGNLDCTLVELDPKYCQHIAEEHNLTVEAIKQEFCAKCHNTDPNKTTGVEYAYGSPDRYDGVSEWRCAVCHARTGRWSGKVLTGGEKERRFGVDYKDQETLEDGTTLQHRYER